MAAWLWGGVMSYSHMAGGDTAAATACFEGAVRVSVDPGIPVPSLALCYARIAHGEYHGLQETPERIVSFKG